MKNTSIEIPLPEQVTKEARDDAVGAYLMMFASLIISLPIPFLNVIAALIYLIVMRKKSQFVRFHSVQSFISQCIVSIINSILIIIIIVRFINAVRYSSYDVGFVREEHYYFSSVFTTGFSRYIWAAVIINLLYLILSIIAAIYAHNGEIFSIWGIGSISKKIVFTSTSTDTKSRSTHSTSSSEGEKTKSNSKNDNIK